MSKTSMNVRVQDVRQITRFFVESSISRVAASDEKLEREERRPITRETEKAQVLIIRTGRERKGWSDERENSKHRNW